MWYSCKLAVKNIKNKVMLLWKLQLSLTAVFLEKQGFYKINLENIHDHS